MKYCPACGKKYENSMRFCMEDGTPLPDVDVNADTLRMEHSKTQSSIPTLYLKTKTVSKGDYVDIVLPNLSFRITVEDIREADIPNLLFGNTSKELAAHILLTSSTPLILCNGSQTKRIELNEYVLPVESGDSETRSLFSFFLNEEKAILFRLFVTHINFHSGKVEFNWAYFRYLKD